MGPIEQIEMLWALDEPDIRLSAVEYNDLAVAVSELPQDEQSAWDDTILNFVYNGKKIVVEGVNDTEPAPQGE